MIYGNWEYSTVAGVSVDGDGYLSHYFLFIPSSWSIAHDNAETRNVIAQHRWSTNIGVVDSGRGIWGRNGNRIDNNGISLGFTPGSVCCSGRTDLLLTDDIGRVCPFGSGTQIIIVRPA